MCHIFIDNFSQLFIILLDIFSLSDEQSFNKAFNLPYFYTKKIDHEFWILPYMRKIDIQLIIMLKNKYDKDTDRDK